MTIPFFENIKAIPVLRPLFFYSAGWLFAYMNQDLSLLFGIQALHFLLILVLFSYAFRKYFNSWTQIVLVLSAFFFIGVFSYEKDEEPDGQYDSEMNYLAEVIDFPIEKENTYLIRLKLLYSYSDSFSFGKKVYTNAYFEKTENASSFPRIGEQCIIKMRLAPVKNNGNPYEFNYAAWLKRKNIFFTAFVKAENWFDTEFISYSFLYKCKSYREWLKNKVLDYKKGEFLTEKAVLLAITLGSKELLDPAVKSDFADAGAIHIMAVSGLHVGLIWMFIGFLTSFLKRTFMGRVAQFILILFILWCYACITGLSPSVTRSCLMFSLVSFGSLIGRASSVYNTLFLSAFLQLLFNPNLLLDTGFQFSYAAVLSILFFQPLIKKSLFSKWFILNWFFDLIAVSIAAQVLTFPLAIYYFHQFPASFILSNILVIPVVTILMMVFISSVFLIFLPLIYNSFLNILIFLCSIMIKSVNFIATLPFSTILNLNISIFQMGLLLFFSLLFLLFIHNRKLFSLKFSMFILSIFFISGIYRYSERLNNRLLVFNVPDILLIDILNGGDHYLIHNIEEEIDLGSLSFYTKNYWIQAYSNKPLLIHIDSLKTYHTNLSYLSLPGNSNFKLFLGERSFTFVGDFKGISDFKTDFRIDTDALIVFDRNFNPNYNKQNIIEAERIIIAPNCKIYSSWVSTLDESYYFVKEQGSVAFDLN